MSLQVLKHEIKRLNNKVDGMKEKLEQPFWEKVWQDF